MKIYLLGLLLCSTLVKAQYSRFSAGLISGCSNNMFVGPHEDKLFNRPVTNMNNDVGIRAGLYVSRPLFRKKVEGRIEFLYFQKGIQLRNNGYFYDIDMTLRINVIEVPVVFIAPVGRYHKVGFGVYSERLWNIKWDETVSQDLMHKPFRNIGAGLTSRYWYHLMENIYFTVGFQQSSISVVNIPKFKAYHRNILVGLEYKF